MKLNKFRKDYTPLERIYDIYKYTDFDKNLPSNLKVKYVIRIYSTTDFLPINIYIKYEIKKTNI